MGACPGHYGVYSIYMYIQLTLCACTLGTVAKIMRGIYNLCKNNFKLSTLVTTAAFLAQLTSELSTDEADNSGFFSILRVCMFSCHAMCILVVTLWLAKLVCMHAVLGPK